MAAISAFRPLVYIDCPGVPNPVMDDAIRRAAREFCKKTQALTIEVNITLAVADNSYAPTMATGTEILAVQTLRNALMSATISASTAALALMAAASLLGGAALHGEVSGGVPTVRGACVLGLLATLFASFVSAAMAVRLYNHAGFMTSLPAGSAVRHANTTLAVAYLQRAGHFHSWSLRTFFLVAPLVVGLLAPVWMPLAAIGLVAGLAAFDRVPATD